MGFRSHSATAKIHAEWNSLTVLINRRILHLRRLFFCAVFHIFSFPAERSTHCQHLSVSRVSKGNLSRLKEKKNFTSSVIDSVAVSVPGIICLTTNVLLEFLSGRKNVPPGYAQLGKREL